MSLFQEEEIMKRVQPGWAPEYTVGSLVVHAHRGLDGWAKSEKGPDGSYTITHKDGTHMVYHPEAKAFRIERSSVITRGVSVPEMWPDYEFVNGVKTRVCAYKDNLFVANHNYPSEYHMLDTLVWACPYGIESQRNMLGEDWATIEAFDRILHSAEGYAKDFGSFWASFYEALTCADSANLAKLGKGYPREVAAWCLRCSIKTVWWQVR